MKMYGNLQIQYCEPFLQLWQHSYIFDQIWIGILPTWFLKQCDEIDNEQATNKKNCNELYC